MEITKDNINEFFENNKENTDDICKELSEKINNEIERKGYLFSNEINKMY